MADLSKFRQEQKEAAEKVVLEDQSGEINLIGAADQISISKNVISGIVLTDRDFKVVESSTASIETDVPYIPTYLYFREGPAFIKAFKGMTKKPDVLLVKGNGILHPYRCGFASHIGVTLDVPTIGVAKTLLVGTVDDQGNVVIDGEVRGKELRTKSYAKPIYVSPGHKITLETAAKLVKEFTVAPHKLPEPLHRAHKYANKLKKEILGKDKPEEK